MKNFISSIALLLCMLSTCYAQDVSNPPILIGDVNTDGVVDFRDIGPFISILSNRTNAGKLRSCPSEVCLIGDSFYESRAEAGGLFDQRFPGTVDLSLAIPGATVGGIPTQLVNSGKQITGPVFIMRGTNDITGSVALTVQQFMQRLQDAVDAVVASGADPADVFVSTVASSWPGPPSTPGFHSSQPIRVNAINDLIRDTYPENRIIDVNTVLDPDQDSEMEQQFQIAPGNRHPNALGSQVIADEMIRVFSQVYNCHPLVNGYSQADIDQNGDVNFLDISLFIGLLSQ